MVTLVSNSFIEALLHAYGQVIAQWGNKSGIPNRTKKGSYIPTWTNKPFLLNVCLQG
jgi:hypothetical protein